MNESSNRRRPIGVWIISIPYIFTSASFLLWIFLFRSGIVQAPPDSAASIANIEPFFPTAYSLLYLVAAIELFRLEKVAFYLFAILLGFSLVNIKIDGLFGTTFDWIILIAICIYTWRLKQKGVLR